LALVNEQQKFFRQKDAEKRKIMTVSTGGKVRL